MFIDDSLKSETLRACVRGKSTAPFVRPGKATAVVPTSAYLGAKP
jgi:hypothetical protein